MKVFLCESIHPDALALLRTRVQIIDEPARISEVDAILSRNLRLDREMLSSAGCLRCIAVHGTGLDGVDLDYCRKKGIVVFNTPGENAASVAELIVALSLTLLHKIHLADRLLQSGSPVATASPRLFGAELSGRTVGFIGAGNIARRAAQMFSAGFGAKILACTPSLTPARAAESGMRAVTMEALMETADIVAVCAPLNETTRGMIDAAALARMKPSAILINTSRGGIVDEAALYAALIDGTIAAAACDVFTSEPPTRENPLLKLDNFVATPHIGANTDEALRRVGLCVVEQLLAYAEGILPKYLVL